MIVAFERDGIRFERCKNCPTTSERFVSTTKHPLERNGVVISKEKRFKSIHGVQWALGKGYTPIYEI